MYRDAVERMLVEHAAIGDEGPSGRSTRIGKTAAALLAGLPGNALEIGGGVGQTTIGLLKAAAPLGKRVLVVDPWEDARDQPPGYGAYGFDEFCAAVAPWRRHLVICHQRSQHPSVAWAIEAVAPLAFAFIDGLQLEEAVASDLELAARFRPPVIAVDDADRLSAISRAPPALEAFLASAPYTRVELPRRTIEAYLVRR